MLYSFALAAVLSAILSRRVVALPSSSPLYHSGPEILAARQQQQQPSCLRPELIQSASSLTGQEPGTKGIKAGQAAAATYVTLQTHPFLEYRATSNQRLTRTPSDKYNFINFCEGHTITNGQQLAGGSCNGIPMGRLPSEQNMISSVITSPRPGDRLPARVSFNVTVQTAHLRAGVFTNPMANYYTAPQDLDLAGDIIGHCHITIQEMGSLTPTTPPDASKFAFFKGVDDAGDGKGLLTASVDGGLPPGVYRVCTLVSAATHQPVVMPAALRGPQDDCTKFEVAAGGMSAAGAAAGAKIIGTSGVRSSDSTSDGSGSGAAKGGRKNETSDK
ncbi:hypothetical protein CSUB01_02113 [Colletotrichum sublineola]|uniref:Uncharacterized protein n=1 Tax=Colletotrichum sublineola TaxID=1173701 RepID=A0A066WYX7_COLSU|nr:hypothetical protein CSUB01_02113 [Colletotrichum sublineola]